MNREDYLTDCPDVDECESCGYAGEMVCDTFEGEYWIICAGCGDLLFEGGEVPVEGA
jgi:hypothetical protein